jgi:hypothetical protein
VTDFELGLIVGLAGALLGLVAGFMIAFAVIG